MLRIAEKNAGASGSGMISSVFLIGVVRKVESRRAIVLDNE